MDANCPGLHTRITERLRGGIPDVITQFASGHMLWTELKYIKGGEIVGHGIGIRADQALFLRKHVAAGGKAAVVVFLGDGDWYLFPAQATAQWVRDIQSKFVEGELGRLGMMCRHGNYWWGAYEEMIFGAGVTTNAG
jgi:hypothetical protein